MFRVEETKMDQMTGTWKMYNNHDDNENNYLRTYLYTIKFTNPSLFTWTSTQNILPGTLNYDSVLSGLITVAIQRYILGINES